MYAILGQYYHGKQLHGKDICFVKHLFLGAEGMARTYVYEDEPTKNTLLFETKYDAKDYINLHKLNRHKDGNTCTNITTKQHIVTEIEFY